MKSTLLKLSALFLVCLSFACEGPEGPPGPTGPRGPEGPEGPEGRPGPEAVVIEYENVDFLAPEFGVFLDFGDYATLPSDVVLVYALWEVEESAEGERYEIWRLLPQSIFLDNDRELVYNFDHTDVDVDVFLEANFDLEQANLPPAYLEDWIVRIVIVPGQYLQNSRGAGSIDYSNYRAVKKRFNLPDLPSPVSGKYQKLPLLD